MSLRHQRWIWISLILPIAFTVITIMRPSGPPTVEMEEVPMPKRPPLPEEADAGGLDKLRPDAGQADAALPTPE